MLWYKVWRETRWRFFVGLLLSLMFCVLVVTTYAPMEGMRVDVPNLGGRLGELVNETLTLSATYRGYVWSQWFAKNLVSTWALFAVIIGVGGVTTESGRGTALYTLSLPVTRACLQGVRAAVCALEMLALAFAPSLLVPLLSPLVGESFSVIDTLVYSSLTAAGGTFFLGLSFLLSSIFADRLKPIVIGVVAAFGMQVLPIFSRTLERYNVYGVMSGRSYFQSGALPWAGLAACAALAAAMYWLSLRFVERRDF